MLLQLFIVQELRSILLTVFLSLPCLLFSVRRGRSPRLHVFHRQACEGELLPVPATLVKSFVPKAMHLASALLLLDKSEFTGCTDVDSAPLNDWQQADTTSLCAGSNREANTQMNILMRWEWVWANVENGNRTSLMFSLFFSSVCQWHTAHIFKPHAVFKRLHELAYNYSSDNKREIWSRDTLIDPDTVTMFTKANILPGKRRLPPAGHANYCVPAEASISTHQLLSGR